jgi:hypothetical protein
MPNTDSRLLRLAMPCLVGAVIGWAAATSSLSPIRPKPNRPFLSFIAKLAKTGLWVMAFADAKPPEPMVVRSHFHNGDAHALNHAEGW